MKKIYFLSLTILLQLFSAHAQNINWQYHSTHHDANNENKAYSVIQTQDGNYVFVGKYGSNGNGNGDIYITKLSSSGSMLWSKTYGDTLGDEGRSVKELADGSLIVSGFTFQMGDTVAATSYKACLMKLDANGDSVWFKRFISPGVSLGDGFGNCVTPTFDGGFVFVGKYSNPGNGNDFYILKTDANGDSVWAKLYGGTGADIARSVVETADHGFIVSGTTKSAGQNPSAGNMWLLKTNSTGDTLWTKAIGGTDFEECFMARPIPGGYILAGRTGSDVTHGELNAVKTDASGNVVWSQTFGNPANNDFGRDIVQTADKGFALIGARVATHGYYLGPPSLMYVVKMDSTGAQQWDSEQGYDNTPNGATGLCIANTADGGLIAAGFDQPNGGFSGEDLRAFIVKYAPLPVSVLPQQQGSQQCLVYPNPFSDVATLIIPSDMKGAAILDIYNAEGQKIMSKALEAGVKQTSVSKKELSCGMYFYHLHAGKEEANLRGKIIVQ